MRYYRIIITKKDGTVFIPPSMKNFLTKESYTSVIGGVKGRPLYSGLDLSLDIPVTTLAQPRQGAKVVISGVSLEDIAQFTYLPEATIEIQAGMLDGYLPLAKNYQPDLLMRGTIYWASGNWEGVNMTLELGIVPLLGLDPIQREKKLMNMVFNWDTGTKLEDAIRTMLNATYAKTASNPDGYNVQIDISDKLVAFEPQMGAPFPSLSKFGEKIKSYTKAKFPEIKTVDGSDYDGVEIKVVNKTITVFDHSKDGNSRHPMSKPLEILLFTEIIGQPGWKTQYRMTFKTVMRGDIDIQDWVKLPDSLRSPYVTTTVGVGQAPNDAQGITQPSKNALTFKGAFEVIEIRHIGQFRQASAMSWVTVFDALPIGNRRDEPPKPTEPLVGPPAPLGPRAPAPPPPSTTTLPPYQLFPPIVLPPPAPPTVTLPPFVIPGFPK